MLPSANRISRIRPSRGRQRGHAATVVEVADEKNSRIIFPVPIEWLKAQMGDGSRKA